MTDSLGGAAVEAVSDLGSALRKLRTEAGNPSYRNMAVSAHVAHTTLSRASHGDALPTWTAVQGFVVACRGEPSDYRAIWERARDAIAPATESELDQPDNARNGNGNGDSSEVRTKEEFLAAMRRLRARYGNAPYAAIATRACVPASTIGDAFNPKRRASQRLPRWEVVEAVLHSFGIGDVAVEQWRQSWIDLTSPVAETPDDDEAVSLMRQARDSGLVGVYLSRRDALANVGDTLLHEVENGGRLWIVGSSLKGLATQMIGRGDGFGLIRQALKEGSDIRLVCTHPMQAEARAHQERRKHGQIFGEIKLSLANLKEAGLRRDQARFCNAAPTVFGVCAGDYMLLNPYPYGNEAYLNFCLVARKNFRGGIFERYFEGHFRESWELGDEIERDDWESYGADAT